MEKTFFWKDKTGRGFTNEFSEQELIDAILIDHPEWKDMDDEELEEEDSIHGFAESASIGDEWNDTANYVIRIK